MLFVYPAIVYNKKDEEPYVVVVPDINIVAEGESLEDAVLDAKSQLKIYLQCVKKFGANLPKATDFETFKDRFSEETIMFIDCMLSEQDDDDITIIF